MPTGAAPPISALLNPEVIEAVREQNFDDPPVPQWVMSFGGVEPELRVKPGVGRPLFEAFGNQSSKWIGRQIARVPDSVARIAVRAILGTAATRRHVVFGRLFGMREVRA